MSNRDYFFGWVRVDRFRGLSIRFGRRAWGGRHITLRYHDGPINRLFGFTWYRKQATHISVGRVTLTIGGRYLPNWYYQLENRVWWAVRDFRDRMEERRQALAKKALGIETLVAVYELDRAYGGPEEGGWYYDCGELVRVVKRFDDERKARAYASRLNDKLYSRMKYYGWASSSSVSYAGGEYEARVYDNEAPEYFPNERQYYE